MASYFEGKSGEKGGRTAPICWEERRRTLCCTGQAGPETGGGARSMVEKIGLGVGLSCESGVSRKLSDAVGGSCKEGKP